MTKTNLEKWVMHRGHGDKLVFTFALQEFIADTLSDDVESVMGGLYCQMLDMQLTRYFSILKNG